MTATTPLLAELSSYTGKGILTPRSTGAGASSSFGTFGLSIGSAAENPNSAGIAYPSSAGIMFPNSAGIDDLA